MPSAQSIIRRFNGLKSRRDGYWRNLWTEVRRFCMPDEEADTPEASTQSAAKLYDTTAIEARGRLASGMFTWMAPGDRKWFRLVPENRSRKPSPAVSEWFAVATESLSDALLDSNFHGELLKSLNDLACGIDAVLYCEESSKGLSFRCFPVEDICYSVDESDALDTVFREFKMTSRQAAKYFGEMGGSAIPQRISEEASSESECDRSHTFLHVVMPRDGIKPDAAGREHMAFSDYFIFPEESHIIREGGYEEMPYAICRFRKSTREHYGRGPGIDLLPDIRMLNAMRNAFILNVDFASDPSWLIPEGSLVSRNFNRNPGSLIFFRPGLGGAAPQPVNRGTSVQIDAQVIEGERQRIRNGFFWDVFDPLGDIRNMTAQEATIRNESKLVPFGPIACNIHKDLFAPLLQRAFGILVRSGRIPPAPPMIVDSPTYKVEFQSRIALAMKRQAALGWLQTESTIQGIAAANPAVMDNFDTDAIARDVAESNGCEAGWLLRKDKVDAIRAERQRQADQQRQADALSAMAGNAGQLGKRPEPGSPLQGMMDAANGGQLT